MSHGPADGRHAAVLFASAGGGATRSTVRGERIRRARIADSIAALVDVAGACGRATLRHALFVHRACRPAARAVFGNIAVAGGRAATHRARCEAVGGTRVVEIVTKLRDVAWPGRGAALGRALRVWRTGGRRAGTAPRQIPDAGGGQTDSRWRQRV